jgi:hypothetical protein
MYERSGDKLISRAAFVVRLLRHGAAALIIATLSLVVGMVGYALLGHMPWVDAFLNAAMILGGMGPVGDLTNDAVKLFAGAYALYSGVFFIVVTGILLAPVVHRIIHSLHVDEDDDDKAAKPGA